MSTTHTKGPWTVKSWPRENYVDGMAYVITDSRGRGIASMLKKGRSLKALTNAKLLAKSPELLDLVKLLMDEYRPDAAHDEAYYPAWALADAIIKDIEG